MLFTAYHLPLLLVLSAGHVQAAARSAADLFHVDFGKSGTQDGGCGDVGEGTMNSYVADSWTLAVAGVQLMDDYDNGVAEAQRLVGALFKPQGGSNVVAGARNAFKAVQDFLEGNRGIDGGTPYLFCQSTWLQRFTMSDDYLNSQGLKELATDEQGLPYTLKNREVQHMIDAQLDYGGIPYYSWFHHAYVFDRDYSNKAVGYCSARDNRGATQEVMKPKTITLCPRAFRPARGLRAVNVAKPVTLKQLQDDIKVARTNSKAIGDVFPTAATLFHELFHLVLGNDATFVSAGGEEYAWADMVALSAADSLRNPESYTVAAVAYDITTNYNPVNGHRLEFFAQYGTRG